MLRRSQRTAEAENGDHRQRRRGSVVVLNLERGGDGLHLHARLRTDVREAGVSTLDNFSDR
jgi:hypothetical protein